MKSSPRRERPESTAQSPHVQAKKSLGQNFLHDTGVLARIAALAQPAAGSGIIEIGPGTGNLTEYLLKLGAPLHTVERDASLVPILRARFGSELPIHLGDAAELDWPALLADPGLGPHPVVVGNLPYYAAIPILFATLEAKPARLVFMVQKEVAARLIGHASSPEYGQISVKIQMLADIRIGLRVGRGAFTPAPKVESAVIVLEPLESPRFSIKDWPRFSKLVTDGFAARRKTLVNSLLLSGHDPARVLAALDALGLDPRVRGEALDLKQWAGIAHQLAL